MCGHLCAEICVRRVYFLNAGVCMGRVREDQEVSFLQRCRMGASIHFAARRWLSVRDEVLGRVNEGGGKAHPSSLKLRAV